MLQPQLSTVSIKSVSLVLPALLNSRSKVPTVCKKGLLTPHVSCALLLFPVSCSVVSESLRPPGLQHARLPCPPPSSGACSLVSFKSVMPSCHLIFCHPLLLFQSFPASGSFQMNQLFASGGQSFGASTSTSVLPMNTQGCIDGSQLGTLLSSGRCLASLAPAH